LEASKNLRRPANWQDFETLCKKLWGEIWDCPEIIKNGRIGQSQNGVDVYGMPFGEDLYYGIQCKGKDEYSNKQFTEIEIIEEITKAKLFRPPLKKLYFATTAIKDAGIEEFVRTKNIENRAAGLFEVHIFSWEDIVDLIDENKQTHDWYLKSQNFKTSKSISVTFQNDLQEITITPKYKRIVTSYIESEIESYSNSLESHLATHKKVSSLFTYPVSSKIEINLSYCILYFKIQNTGQEPIEEFKLFFEFTEEIMDLTETNEKTTGFTIPLLSKYISDVYLSTESMSGKIIPKKTILVGDDTFVSDDIYIKPLAEEYEIAVKWKLISKDFKDEGALKIFVKPNLQIKYRNQITDDPSKVGTTSQIDKEVLVNKED